MRAPIIGAYFGKDIENRNRFVGISTRITHTDPKALAGALAVALAAAMASGNGEIESTHFLGHLRRESRDWDVPRETIDEFIGLAERTVDSVRRGDSTPDFAASLGLDQGVTGYIYHTVPVVLHSWLTFPSDYRNALEGVILCGGDTDSTGAIVGALVGARTGVQGIPQEWIERILEWPRTRNWIRNLGHALATHSILVPSLPVPLTLARNLAFLPVVFAHGIRRLLPPY